jgi:hypothetical protein
MKTLISRLSLGFACTLALVGVITMNSAGSVMVRDGNLPSDTAPAIKIGDLDGDKATTPILSDKMTTPILSANPAF